ncbi:MAG: UV DNA damage repair endonuclease UvsE [Sarcina sp.]
MIGYACIPLTTLATTNKRLILKNFSEDKFLEITSNNINGLKEILIHNLENDIKFFRISSDIIPLASHEQNDIPWWDIFKDRLLEIGDIIKNNNMRVSMHSTQFTVINSPNKSVVESSIKDLEYHCKFLDSLGLDEKHKIIIHVGGIYKDKTLSTENFKNNFLKLNQHLKNRLIIENDEKSFSLDDVLSIANYLDCPVVFDNLHNSCYGDNNYELSYILDRVCRTWSPRDGSPKVHYSQQAKDKRKGSHSRTINTLEFLEYYHVAKNFPIDIMLEVKDKDISAIKCTNIVKELNQPFFPSEIIEKEWKRYELLVLERGIENYNLCATLVKGPSIIELYKAIDLALESPIDEIYLKNSLNKAIKLCENQIKDSEEKYFNKLMENREFLAAKSYLNKIILRNNVNELVESYYFSRL